MDSNFDWDAGLGTAERADALLRRASPYGLEATASPREATLSAGRTVIAGTALDAEPRVAVIGASGFASEDDE